MSTIEVACVIPAHRQPGLLAEAIASVLDQTGLDQDGAPPVAAVVVDDGCPHPETAAVAAAFAARHPGRVFALRRPNGGLCAARNTGIDFALAAFPGLRALHFLDADNRLAPRFVARALAALDAAPPQVGWVYPDIDEIGATRAWSTAGPYSPLAHLTENYCEAGSLVRRALLETPIRFNEALRRGFEDWDFWLQAQAAGWRGQHLPDAGFRYRRRPESMLRDAERAREFLLDDLRRRHAPLWAPRRILALEAAEAPRHAIWCDDAVTLALDPDAPPAAVLDPAAARTRWLTALAAPAAAHFPAVLVFAEAAALRHLRAAGAIRGVFRDAVARLAHHPLAAVEITLADTSELALRDRPAEVPRQAPLIVADTLRVAELLRADPSAPGRAPAARFEVLLPAGPASPGALLSRTPHARLLAELAALDAAASRPSAIAAGWRREFRAPRATAAARALAPLGLGTLLPILPGGRSIAFVLPVFALGGVEQVVTSQALVLRARGWRTHLLVLGAARATLSPAVTAAFESVSVFAHHGERDAAPPEEAYMGATTAAFGARPGAAEALGLLAHCDVVVNTHALGAHALMAPLRRLGVRTYVALHLIEPDPWGAPMGNPHGALGYEHAYDGVIVISGALADWARAQGLPAAKLHLVRNAPGHPTALSPATLLAARAARTGPPRALFLGRLDAQKGLDRLAVLIAATAGRIAWRVVGRAVLDEAPPAPGVAIEPPATTPAELDALYAWADILVLPSRYEGVPLTILEAQRLGCAVLATAAGAVEEIVQDGVDGLLVSPAQPEAAILGQLLTALERLAAGPALRLALGRRAAARVAGLDWARTMEGFLAHLDASVPA